MEQTVPRICGLNRDSKDTTKFATTCTRVTQGEDSSQKSEISYLTERRTYSSDAKSNDLGVPDGNTTMQPFSFKPTICVRQVKSASKKKSGKTSKSKKKTTEKHTGDRTTKKSASVCNTKEILATSKLLTAKLASQHQNLSSSKMMMSASRMTDKTVKLRGATPSSILKRTERSAKKVRDVPLSMHTRRTERS